MDAGDATPEEWKSVPLWDGFYEISNKGRLRSVDRAVITKAGWIRHNPGRIMRTFTNRDGNPAVILQGAGRQREHVAVHLLVERAFGFPLTTVAPPDPGEPERWLPIENFEGLYAVSDLGRVRSFHRGKGKGKRGGVLRPHVAGRTNIHLRVVLHGDDRQETRLVHQLVMEAFVGPRPDGMEVCHGPGGALDNRLVNLSYGTRAKNCGPDKIRDGTLIYGEDHVSSRLTEQIVIECRRRYAAGETTTVLAAEFGVNAGTMGEAVTGETWARVPGVIPRGSEDHHRKGAEHPHAKNLTPEIVKEIRDRSAAGETWVAIAAVYGVGRSTVGRVLHGQHWAAPGERQESPRPRAKLTAEAVLECRRRCAAGERIMDLAREYGVSSNGLGQAISGVTWPHLR